MEFMGSTAYTCRENLFVDGENMIFLKQAMSRLALYGLFRVSCMIIFD
jgi:hypothetical protein